MQKEALKGRPEPPGSRLAGAGFLLVAAGIVALLTLTPLEANESLPARCILCGPLGGVDFVLNVFLFVPIGFAVVMMRGRIRHAVLFGALFTLTIECLQWRVVSGRDASLGDLLANTLGSGLGGWLAFQVATWLRSTGTQALKLSAASALLVSGIMVSTAVLLLPSAPVRAQYVQWAPVRPGTVPFPARLLTAELNGRSLRPMLWIIPDWLIQTETRLLTLRVDVERPSSATARRAIIIRVADPLWEALMLAQQGDAVLFRSHIIASRLRLRPPVVALSDAFSAAQSGRPDGVITLEASSNPRAITIQSGQSDEIKGVTVRRSVGLGWVLLSPSDFALGESWWVVNALWLGTLVFPVSFFTRKSGNADSGMARSMATWLPACLVLLGLFGSSVITGLSAPGPGELIGVIAGAAGGWWTERFVAAGRFTNVSDSTIELIEE